MKKRSFTKSQTRILAELLKLNREVPRRELGENLGLSTATFHYGLMTLGDLIIVRQSPGRGNSHLIKLSDEGVKFAEDIKKNGI